MSYNRHFHTTNKFFWCSRKHSDFQWLYAGAASSHSLQWKDIFPCPFFSSIGTLPYTVPCVTNEYNWALNQIRRTASTCEDFRGERLRPLLMFLMASVPNQPIKVGPVQTFKGKLTAAPINSKRIAAIASRQKWKTLPNGRYLRPIVEEEINMLKLYKLLTAT